MPSAALAGATYRKSSRSGASGNCVEVAELPSGHRAIRDSKQPSTPILLLPAPSWAAFTTALHAGEFD